VGNRIGRPESAWRAVLSALTVAAVAAIATGLLLWLATATHSAP
jgi:hypothetical protein